MVCRACGNKPPERSRFCNQCGEALAEDGSVKRRGLLVTEERWIYVDLFDLRLPSDLRTIDQQSEAVSYVYERFTPFADDGWEWVVHPSSWEFSGWVYQEFWGSMKLAGANILCRRTREACISPSAGPQHHISEHRRRQLVQRPWTALPGGKAWAPFHG